MMESLPEGIIIKRDPEEEKNKTNYVCYKMYRQDKVIGVANYRLFRSQNPYWYIDEFTISEQKQGYGTYLLKSIVREMWSQEHLPIEIYPTSLQMPKEKFVAWLVRRGFTEKLDLQTNILVLILYPKIYRIEAFWDHKAQVWTTSSDEVPGLATESDRLESLTQKLRVMVPELLQLNHVLTLDLSNTVLIEVIGHRQEMVEAA